MATNTDQSAPRPETKSSNPGLLSASPDTLALDIPLAWAVSVLPAAGVAAAGYLLWQDGLSEYALASFVILYVVTLLGVEVGFHRLFSHHSFQSKPFVRALLAIFGSMSFQGPVIWWAALHRIHHLHSDQEGDPHSPHSPHSHDNGIKGIVRGLIHAHLGWLFKPAHIRPEAWARKAPDLFRDRILFRIHCQYFIWLAFGLILPTAAVGLLTGSLQGALLGFLWGGLARIFLVNHTIWSVNSICHFSGQRPWKTKDKSRNNIFLAAVSLGASWHNNHHAFPTSAISGLKWWQIDLSGLFIRLLETLGWVWQVNVPSKRAMAQQEEATAESDTESECKTAA